MTTLTRTTTEERRRLPLSTAGLAIRADGDGGAERFAGYASVFNSRTAIGNPLRWGFYEEVAPGAFSKTISEGDARMLIDHDTYYVVSRVSAGSLELAEDDKGLAVDSALDSALSYVGDLKANVRNRNITGMSFGFQVVKDDWQLIDIEVKNGEDTDTVQAELRTLREVKLFEVSAVTFPAYDDTEAGLRAVATALVRRGDSAAIEQRAQYRPELLELLQAIGREPGESTRGADTDTEPAAATRLSRTSVDRRMQALAARYGLAR